MSAPQASVVDPERTFLESLPLIDRVIGIVARRHALSDAESEEFASWARTRIIDSNYAILRKFGGRSSLGTYLSVVISNLFHDYRNSIWGRWRPSAAAQRNGPLGIRLEELIYRDGYTIREAIGVLQSGGVMLSDVELTRIAAKIPAREKPNQVGLESVDTADVAELRARYAATPEDPEILSAVRGALEQLPVEDQVIVRMRFWDDVSVAEIARRLRVEQKPLYRKLDIIQKQLQATLLSRGVDRQRVAEILSGESVSLW
ncbi:MAG TPA: sigma-70 family RNA polymerase sigma factor [Gemmatimonadaceae bacterium]|nr:sigma-70 family RNA polymerase sigma factor [Gemmatimonadaceae bacterium]